LSQPGHGPSCQVQRSAPGKRRQRRCRYAARDCFRCEPPCGSSSANGAACIPTSGDRPSCRTSGCSLGPTRSLWSSQGLGARGLRGRSKPRRPFCLCHSIHALGPILVGRTRPRGLESPPALAARGSSSRGSIIEPLPFRIGSTIPWANFSLSNPWIEVCLLLHMTTREGTVSLEHRYELRGVLLNRCTPRSRRPEQD
jgi:hypothetical protein